MWLLVTKLPLKFTYEHACWTLILLRKPDFYEEYTESNIITSESNIITVTYYLSLYNLVILLFI